MHFIVTLLQITDYSSKDVLRLCGYQRPAPLNYNSKMLIVRFHSDSHHTEDKGVTINFRRLYGTYLII